MTRTVEKEYKWEMAHRLIGWDADKKESVKYLDNCKNLHGHSYKAYVTIKVFDNTLDVYGMVYDYNQMKKLKKWIDKNLDHCIMISKYDDVLYNFVMTQEGRDKHFIINSPSTAENIAELLYNTAQEMFGNGYAKVTMVRVKETTTSEAIYCGE